MVISADGIPFSRFTPGNANRYGTVVLSLRLDSADTELAATPRLITHPVRVLYTRMDRLTEPAPAAP
ncbi:hypothetical protein [Streptomyces sp. NPDC048442]|uniref:hypothetical protein n=1 Tax=Streptomyces sp. NPDC048442 TaxID=3154823 RepID=UPI0034205083